MHQCSAPYRAWHQSLAWPQPVTHTKNVVRPLAWPGVWPGGCKGGLQKLARSWLVGKFRGAWGELLAPRWKDAPPIAHPIFPPIR